MKYLMSIFVAIVIIFLLIILYQNKIAPMYSEDKLNKNTVYYEIKSIIKKGMSRKDVYEILNKQEIRYHNDKNRDIDITGHNLTIEIDSADKVYRFK